MSPTRSASFSRTWTSEASSCPSIFGGAPKIRRCTRGGSRHIERDGLELEAGGKAVGGHDCRQATGGDSPWPRQARMEATATTAAQPTDQPVRRGLPPGPRMPRAMQTAIWSRRAQWMLEQSRARFGDMFTIRIAYEGTWVMVSDPEAVKQVFTGDPRVFHAGEGNEILRPFLGDSSILVLDEKPHIGQRKLLLPPFHGERMQAYGEKMAEIAAREIDGWPLGTPYKLRPGCRRSPWRSSSRPSSAFTAASGWSRCGRRCATSSTSPPTRQCCCRWCSRARSGSSASPRFAAASTASTS